MSQQYYAPQRPAILQAPQNGLGTAGFVLGLIGLLFSPIPLIGVIAWPLVILGLIFSLVGLTRATKGRATNKGLAIAGVVLSVIGLIICILWVAAFGKAVDDVNKESSRVATVQYEITGDAKNVTITYTTFSGDGTSTGQETAATLPWTKSVETTGLAKGGSLAVTASPDGGTVSCKVSVDGHEAKTSTASGPLATATCSDF
jgi:uncharacterized membrane protein